MHWKEINMKLFDLWAKKHPDSVAVKIEGPGMRQYAFPTNVEALWSNLSCQFDAQKSQYEHAALIGFDRCSVARLRDMSMQLSVAQCDGFPSVQVLHDADVMDTHDVIILNFDAFEDVGQAVDTLRQFRVRSPEVAVILISSAVRGDDLGRERAPICDATLRAPVTLPRLRDALQAAMSGHDAAKTARPAH